MAKLFGKTGIRDEDLAAMRQGFVRPNEKTLRALAKQLRLKVSLLRDELDR